MRFRHSALFALLLALPLFCFSIYQFIVIHPEDILSDLALSEKKTSSSHLLTKSFVDCLQENRPHRVQVCKDVWISQPSDKPHLPRLHHRITSARSTLQVVPYETKTKEENVSSNKSSPRFEVIETLERVSCLLQDKLTGSFPLSLPYKQNPMPSSTLIAASQQLRAIEAIEGTYHFRDRSLLTEKAKLSLFKIEGHTLPSSLPAKEVPLIRAELENAAFILGGKIPQFYGKEFQLEVPITP